MIEIKKDKSNSYRFNLKTQGGQTLLKSVVFANKDEIKKTVKELNFINESPTVFERKTNFDGKFLFRLKNKGGQIIGESLLYSSEAGMENGINNLRYRIASLVNLDELKSL